jgi:hypothetical protein
MVKASQAEAEKAQQIVNVLIEDRELPDKDLEFLQDFLERVHARLPGEAANDTLCDRLKREA